MHVSNETQMLLVAAYQDPSTAQAEFDALVARVKAKEVSTKGMILVAKDADGKTVVADTGNELGRKGAGWGGGVGVLVGLFAPPLLASVAIGAAGGAIVGKFAGNKLTETIQEKVADGLKPGMAVVIGVFPAEQRLMIEQSLPGSLVKSFVESDEKGIDELKRALGEAMGKFAPDRTVLPIPDRAFGGVVGRSIADSVADWSIIAPVKPPEGAPNVLLVLIDDGGYA